MMRNQVIEGIKEHKIITIVRGVAGDKIVKTAQALTEGGIHCMEITFNQKDPNGVLETCSSIKQLNTLLGDRLSVGAGTVMNEKQVEAAYEAGARYIISPNTNVAVIKKTVALGMVSIPGAMTATEVCTAYEAGADFVKLFPAGNLGLAYIKSLLGPINYIPMVAVGAIDDTNLKSFIDIGMCGVGIGSNIVNMTLINNGEYDKLTQLAQRYTNALK